MGRYPPAPRGRRPWPSLSLVLLLGVCSLIVLSGLLFGAVVSQRGALADRQVPAVRDVVAVGPGGTIVDAELLMYDHKIRERIARVVEANPGATSPIDPNCYELHTHDNRCAPNFIVVGSMKSGTTSLYSYLSQHPNVSVLAATPEHKGDLHYKEPAFFKKESSLADLKLASYLSIFPVIHAGEGKVTGEASPGYIFDEMAPIFMLSLLPKVRIAMLMRNPVPCAISRIKHWVSIFEPSVSEENVNNIFNGLVLEQLPRVKGCLNKYPHASFHKLQLCWIGQEVPLGPIFVPDFPVTAHLMSSLRKLQFLEHGLFKLQIENWHRHLNHQRHRLLVINSDDFYGSTAETMNKITQHYNLPAIDWTKITSVKHNVIKAPKGARANHLLAAEPAGETHHEMDPTIKKLLEDFYAPHNAELAKYLERPPFWLYE